MVTAVSYLGTMAVGTSGAAAVASRQWGRPSSFWTEIVWIGSSCSQFRIAFARRTTWQW